ncbi:CAP domain-containing protein [Oleiharenicola lentus]|uniref:CAP domain-containing protein n=1 Tax=Oleiharenicola lentus TaxID=2508720 RepID=UPI003F66351F
MAEAQDWTAMSPATFALREEVHARINLANFNRELLAWAIFHETNRVRATLKLPALKHLPKLDQAADYQAGVGALLEVVSHSNPLPDLATLKARVEKAGLTLKIAAENIAATTILEGNTGERSVVVQRVNGRTVLLDPATRRELLPRTYANMAASLVQQWMNSPAHRVNMVSTELEFLGVSARARQSPNGLDAIYAVQVFFTPLEPTASPSGKN